MSNSPSVPLYQQVCEKIRATIDDGTYAPKDRIPSELELSEQYGVSRITVRRAVEELCAKGYLVKQQGRGTFVGTPHIDRRLLAYEGARSFTQVCRDNNMVPGARLVERQIIPATVEQAEFFGMPENGLLLHIKRTRTADGRPIFEENVFLPYEGHECLLKDSLDDVSLFDVIERVGGAAPSQRAFRTIEAVCATAEQATRLSVPKGDALLLLNVGFASASGAPVCIGQQYYVGSRYRFVM